MKEKLRDKLAKLKLFALDVDGVLTDGSLYYTDEGNESRAFNVKDGLGLVRILDAGIEVAIISARDSLAVEKRAKELGITRIKQGVEKKSEIFSALCIELNLSHGECAYMGDDLPDLDTMKLAGIGLTVSDAAPEILEMADWTSRNPGGKGAVREACDMILQAINS